MEPSRPILTLGHSPDADDAFMWWPLVTGGMAGGEPRDGFAANDRPAVHSDRFRFQLVAEDIQKLNDRAAAAGPTGDRLDITAISAATYPYVKQHYALTSCGASLGDGYGPKVVAKRNWSLDEVSVPTAIIAIPGLRTSAWLAARLISPGIGRAQTRVMSFDSVIPAVLEETADAAIVIHEAQMNYADHGLRMVADLGATWQKRHGEPLPLGLNAVRRDLDARFGLGSAAEVAAVLRRSIEYALAHREQGIDYAMQFARETPRTLVDRFVRLYVNQWTVQLGGTGMQAVRRFLSMAHEAGLTPDPGPVDFVQCELTGIDQVAAATDPEPVSM